MKESIERPLLKNSSEEKLINIYNLRKKIYSLADFKVQCGSKNKEQIITEVLQIYEDRQNYS